MNDIERCADGARARRERLSALMDGELDGEAADGCCAHWREQADARSSWHAYHLIGDVLRSQELACSPRHDARLLDAVRGRLAAEPVVLAPDASTHGSAATAAPRRRWGWLAPATVAAGFMAVAGVMLTAQFPSWPGLRSSDALAQASQPSQAALTPPASVAPQPVAVAGREPAALAAPPDGQLVRDAQLDRYLAAHKQFGGSSALGVPSGFLRSATLQAPAR